MLTSQMIKEAAYAAGADKCGIHPSPVLPARRMK